eukprot:4002264-Prymnesium_polylepis.1
MVASGVGRVACTVYAECPLLGAFASTGDFVARGMTDGFDTFFERAVRLGVLSEAQLDNLTDKMAEGAVAAEDLLAEYAPRVAAAALAAIEADEEGGGEAALCADLGAMDVGADGGAEEDDDGDDGEGCDDGDDDPFGELDES